MGIAIDILLALFILASLVYGWKKGLVRGVLQTFHGLLSLIITLAFFQPISVGIKDKFVFPYISKSVHKAVTDAIGGEVVGADGLLEAVPDSVKSVADVFGLNLEALADSAAKSGQEAVDMFTLAVSNSISQLLSIIIGYAVTVVLVYIGLRVCGSLVSAIIEHIPIISTLNRILGVLFATILALFFSWIFVQLLMMLASDSLMIEDTVLTTRIYNFHPLEYFFSGN